MATPENWMHDEDELTEEDLEFLRQFENVVKEDAPEPDETQEGAHVDEDANDDVEIVEGEGEASESGESDEVDESKMDISEIETEQTESSGDNSKTEDQEDGKQVEGEGDTETDEAEFEDDIEQGASDEAAASEHDQDEGYDNDDDYEDDEADDEVEPEGSDSPSPTPDAQAEDESDEMDAQQELEDHLEDEQETPKPPESEQEPSEGDEQGSSQENPEGDFSDIPEASERCTNHCEDNPEEETEHEQCPHCNERLKQERELWGAVAKDMHGQELFPGDKVVVRVPVGLIMHDSIVTVNVPNQSVDPRRVAQKTSGDVDETALWLSGRQISQFTGWRMEGARNPVWIFERGDEISFVERLDHRPPTDDEIEDAIEEFKQDMDELPETPSDDDSEIEESEVEDEAVEDEDEEEESSDENDDEEKDEEKGDKKDELTKAQRDRFDNLTERFIKKIEQTFGSTVEKIEKGKPYTHKSAVIRTIKIQSRGVSYGFAFTAQRKDL